MHNYIGTCDVALSNQVKTAKNNKLDAVNYCDHYLDQ